MLPLFQDNFLLGEATSSHFFRVTTSTQQLLFWDSYFFRTAAFFPFFRTVTFLQEFQDKDIQKRANFLKQLLLHNMNFFRKDRFWKKLIFQKSNIPQYIPPFFWKAAFLERLLLQKTLPSITATFSEELLFYNVLVQKTYYFTATVPFHRCTTYLFFSN